MTLFHQVVAYLSNAENWGWDTPGTLPHLILEHLQYTAMAVGLAALVAIPVGMFIGHTGRGALLAINAGNIGRSMPTLGLLTLSVTLIGIGLAPALFALTILAVPPLLTNTYAGLRAVDPATVDAARGMGMTEWQLLKGVELPIALPIIFSGLRNAVLQVIATATVAAYVALGGLGRLLIDGLALRDYQRVVAGAVLVAALAIVLDLVLGAALKLLVSPGLTVQTDKGAGRAPA